MMSSTPFILIHPGTALLLLTGENIMNSLQNTLLNDQLVDMKFITAFTGLTDKWFYKLIQDGVFPKPIKLGRSSRWLKSEVENWLQQQITKSRG